MNINNVCNFPSYGLWLWMFFYNLGLFFIPGDNICVIFRVCKHRERSNIWNPFSKFAPGILRFRIAPALWGPKKVKLLHICRDMSSENDIFFHKTFIYLQFEVLIFLKKLLFLLLITICFISSITFTWISVLSTFPSNIWYFSMISSSGKNTKQKSKITHNLYS